MQYPQDIVRVKNKFFTNRQPACLTAPRHEPHRGELPLARANGIKITHDGSFVRNPPVPTYVPTLLDFGRRGLLGPDVTLIHGTAFPDEVFQMLKDTGTRVSIAPTSDAHYQEPWEIRLRRSRS